jgi:N,N'-diacetyllegionaminate synthase
MKTYIIAEIGPNHNGSLDLALEMIEKLFETGVDAIKFQLTNPELLYSDDSYKAKYQNSGDASNNSAKELSKSNQLKPNDHLTLYDKCNELGIDYLCTAFDIDSLRFLDNEINPKYFKIASGEIFSLDILNHINKRNKKIILSTGMATYEEIHSTINILNRNFKKDITILHCISNYPTPPKDVNLKVMKELKKRFDYNVGFSDHTEDNTAAIVAVAMGATMIEKHVTTDKNLPGPDHKSSITIDEFADLVKQIRKVEQIFGNKEKEFSKDEMEISQVVRKSIVTANPIKKGDIIKESDICYKRPGIGFLPIEKDLVIGKRATRDLETNKVIKNLDIN